MFQRTEHLADSRLLCRCFEGLKVYRGHDLKLRLFRPNRNTHRMVESATRIALSAFDPDELQKLMEILVAVDGAKVRLSTPFQAEDLSPLSVADLILVVA